MREETAVMVKLTSGQDGEDGSGRLLKLPPVAGPSWTGKCLAISRQWVAHKEDARGASWNLIPYPVVSSVRPAGDGIAVSRPDGLAVRIDAAVLASLEACSLLAEGLSTNPAVAPVAHELLQPHLEAALLRRESSLALRHAIDPSGTIHTFRFHRGRQLILGTACVALGAAFLAAAFIPSFQVGIWYEILFIAGGLLCVWLGIRAFRLGVQVSGSKLTIRNETRTHVIDANDIRAITLEPRPGSGVTTQWKSQVILTNGSSVWIDDFECGPARRPPRPDLAATVEEVRLLLGVRADDISTPRSRKPGAAAG
jgi:hypothetical protein